MSTKLSILTFVIAILTLSCPIRSAESELFNTWTGSEYGMTFVDVVNGFQPGEYFVVAEAIEKPQWYIMKLTNSGNSTLATSWSHTLECAAHCLLGQIFILPGDSRKFAYVSWADNDQNIVSFAKIDETNGDFAEVIDITVKKPQTLLTFVGNSTFIAVIEEGTDVTAYGVNASLEVVAQLKNVSGSLNGLDASPIPGTDEFYISYLSFGDQPTILRMNSNFEVQAESTLSVMSNVATRVSMSVSNNQVAVVYPRGSPDGFPLSVSSLDLVILDGNNLEVDFATQITTQLNDPSLQTAFNQDGSLLAITWTGPVNPHTVIFDSNSYSIQTSFELDLVSSSEVNFSVSCLSFDLQGSNSLVYSGSIFEFTHTAEYYGAVQIINTSGWGKGFGEYSPKNTELQTVRSCKVSPLSGKWEKVSITVSPQTSTTEKFSGKPTGEMSDSSNLLSNESNFDSKQQSLSRTEFLQD